ncbi:hypothetical protein ColLi_01049 [Colletotrichum liriopes]|uniref:Uncharacterized protein n=1 Tax=Colletotrichum liriopes TaxID=708192 RepID=A0AA37GC59_9PEZI|nr:hypothetical protein ColLi_01049 [Colletotrichum liriopes]
MPFVIIVFENRRRLIALPDSYQSLIDKARDFFNLSDSNADLIVYFTPPFLDQEVELDPTAFDAVTDKCLLRLEETPSHTCKDAVYEPARKRPKRGQAKITLSSSNDFTTGIECSYLFWEADALADLSCADISREYPFNPRNPRIQLTDNIILPFADFVPYLDRALASLTLTPAMRTDFIVYWLPNFQKIRDRGLDISFAFIPQTAFEKVAKLNIDPQPMTVARVFLVFDGVTRGGTMDLADVEAIDWATRIGINVAGMEDQTSFRVLEWGGMEANMG